MELEINNKNKESNKLIVCHQNLMSLSKKRDEVSRLTQSNLIGPLIFISECHMRKQEINLSLNNYTLASGFCREEFSEGEVCLMTRHDINFSTIDLNKICSEKTLEICAIKLNTKMIKMIACCMYGSPSINLDELFKLLEYSLNFSLYQPHLSTLW
jgi:hypothetical protein